MSSWVVVCSMRHFFVFLIVEYHNLYIVARGSKKIETLANLRIFNCPDLWWLILLDLWRNSHITNGFILVTPSIAALHHNTALVLLRLNLEVDDHLSNKILAFFSFLARSLARLVLLSCLWFFRITRCLDCTLPELGWGRIELDWRGKPLQNLIEAIIVT